MSDIHPHTLFLNFGGSYTIWRAKSVVYPWGFNIGFLVFLSFFPYGQKQVSESIGKCIQINIMN